MGRIHADTALLVCALVWLPYAPVEGQPPIYRSYLRGPAAEDALVNGDSEERADAARTLGHWGRRGRAVTALMEALVREADTVVLREIVLALARRGDPVALPALIAATEDRSGADPALFIALGAFRDPRAVDMLLNTMIQAEVKERGRVALLRIGAPAVPVLVQALSNPGQRLSAIEVLGELGDMEAVPRLLAMLSDEQEAVRVAALNALANIGDERAGPSVARLYDDPSSHVVEAALAASGFLGDTSHVPELRRRSREGAQEQQRAALTALLELSPETALPLIAHRLRSQEDLEWVLALILSTAHPAAVPLQRQLLRGRRAAETASALSGVEGGAGLPVLVEAAQGGGPNATAIRRALAVGLRRWGEEANEVRSAGWAALSGDETDRGLLLRALALDPRVADTLVSNLEGEPASRRATAALGLEFLADVDTSASLVEALLHERNPEAYRRMASAAARLGGSVPLARLWPALDDPEIAPEAMALAGAAAQSAPLRQRRRLGRLLRAALRDEDPRMRVGAAWALSIAEDRAAWRALATALDDSAPEVRLAAAHALGHLEAANAVEALEARLRVEEVATVRSALADAALVPSRRSAPARGARGQEVLRVRVVATGSQEAERIPVDILLPDGRWLRTETLQSGEILYADLPSGKADIRVRLQNR